MTHACSLWQDQLSSSNDSRSNWPTCTYIEMDTAMHKKQPNSQIDPHLFRNEFTFVYKWPMSTEWIIPLTMWPFSHLHELYIMYAHSSSKPHSHWLTLHGTWPAHSQSDPLYRNGHLLSVMNPCPQSERHPQKDSIWQYDLIVTMFKLLIAY